MSKEIRDEMQHILDELKLLQSFGVYSREKIEELMNSRKELQELCPHENVKELEENHIYMCEDCKKMFYR